MKVVKEEISGKGRQRILFALGKREAELILGSLRATYKYFPITTERFVDRSTLLTMIRSISEAFPSLVHRQSDKKRQT